MQQKRLTLVRIAEPGIGPVAGLRQGSVNALAAVRRRTHIPGADPANGSDRGAAIWKKRCRVLCGGSRQGRSQVRQGTPSGHSFWNFERLSHVVFNSQSLSVGVGNVICFCSPNGQ
jgi:hypothetical protein